MYTKTSRIFLFFLFFAIIPLQAQDIRFTQHQWRPGYDLRKLGNTTIFQGNNKKKNYFEGWYFKMVAEDGSAIMSVIPGIALSKDGKEQHAFIQTINGVTAETRYYSFPIEAFSFARKGFEIKIGKNYFSKERISLDLNDGSSSLKGEVNMINPVNYKSGTLLNPGIMGWFRFVPFMECYHGVVSLTHDLQGQLSVDNQVLNFDGGKGYIEKDYGSGMPSAWIEADAKRLEKYGKLMETQADIYQKLIPYKIADLYFNEAGLNGADVVPFSGKFEKLIQMFNRKNLNQKAINEELDRLRPLAEQFYKDWDYTIDLEMYRNMFFLYYENVGDQFKTEVMYDALKQFNGDVDAYARWAFENSMITSPAKLKEYLVKVDTTNIEVLTSDPVYQLSISFYKVYTERVGNQMKRLENEQGFYYNLYMEALAEMNKGQNVAPDANRTQRLSYGRVLGASPADGLSYNYYTTLEGLFEKNTNNPDNPDYYVPKKLQSIHQAKDYGRYATNGTVRVNFLTNNHTTSGSSGSPVLNRRGELIGLNFDRLAEGVASDYQFLPELSRSIVVDIRYVLFLLEKYSPSSHLISEMTITTKK